MSATSIDIAEAALVRLTTARLGPDIAYARIHGIDLVMAEACAGCLTVNGIRPRQDGTFDFDDDGVEGAVIEVLGEDAESIHDLIAWPLDMPHRWRLWGGTVGALGTAAAVNAATYFDGQPLRVFRNPLRWLQAGGGGLAWCRSMVAGPPGICSTSRPWLTFWQPRTTSMLPSSSRPGMPLSTNNA